VREAGLSSMLPFTGNNSSGSYSSTEITLPPGAPLPHAQVRSVDVGYARALGLTLLRGRWFNDTDRLGTQQVVVVDRLLGDHYWPGQDPIGKRISRNGVNPDGSIEAKDLWTIVGVVAPVKNQNLEEHVTKETIYFPFAQHPDTGLYLIAKTDADPGTLAASLRAAIRRADPEQPIFDVKTMTDRMTEIAQPRRAPMILLSLFSSVALLLASLGVYGVLAFSVTQRTAEFGVRLALGATPANIAALVLRDGTKLVIVGVVAGLAGYLALSRVVAQLLYGVSAADPITLAAAPLILALVALVASLLPARRATRVDPMVALRAE
jgi:predicted permease